MKTFFIDDLVSTAEAAKIAGLKRQLFYIYYKRGLTPKAVVIGATHFFNRHEIAKWKKPVLKAGRPRKPESGK